MRAAAAGREPERSTRASAAAPARGRVATLPGARLHARDHLGHHYSTEALRTSRIRSVRTADWPARGEVPADDAHARALRGARRRLVRAARHITRGASRAEAVLFTAFVAVLVIVTMPP